MEGIIDFDREVVDSAQQSDVVEIDPVDVVAGAHVHSVHPDPEDVVDRNAEGAGGEAVGSEERLIGGGVASGETHLLAVADPFGPVAQPVGILAGVVSTVSDEGVGWLHDGGRVGVGKQQVGLAGTESQESKEEENCLHN